MYPFFSVSRSPTDPDFRVFKKKKTKKKNKVTQKAMKAMTQYFKELSL